MRNKLRLAIKNKDKKKAPQFDTTKWETRQNYERIRNHTWYFKFSAFCNKLEAKSDCKRISSLIKNNNDTNLGMIRKPGGDLSESPSETLDFMIPVHFGDQPGKNDQPANDVGREAPPSKLHSSDNIVQVKLKNR